MPRAPTVGDRSSTGWTVANPLPKRFLKSRTSSTPASSGSGGSGGTTEQIRANHSNPCGTTLAKLIRHTHFDSLGLVAALAERDDGRAPQCLRRYLQATHAISSDEQLAQHGVVHRHYRQEWLASIAEARRRGLPRVAPSRSPALTQGTIP